MPEIFIPLVGSYNKRSGSSYDKDARFINVLFEVAKNPISQKTTVYVRRRSGTTVHQTDATGIGGPMHIWAGLNNEIVTARFLVAGPNTVTVYVGNATITGGTVGPFDNGCISISETTLSGTPTLIFVMLHGSTRSYYWYQSGGTLTLINDADFPTNTVGEPGFIDGYMLVMDTQGRVYNSDINSVSGWTAGSYISTSATVDKGTGVVVYGDRVLAFGERGCEPLYNAGNTVGSPLARVQGGAFNVGKRETTSASLKSHLLYQSRVYWCDTNRAMYTLSGGTPVRLDSSGLSHLGVAQGFQGGFQFMGKLLIAVRATNTIDGITMLYSPEDNTWVEFAPRWVSSNNLPHWFGQNTGTSAVHFNDNYSAVVYLWNGNVWTDEAIYSYTSRIQTSNIDFGQGRGVTFDRIDLVADKRTTSGSTNISWSDDDFQTFSTARAIDLSTNRHPLLRCGYSRNGRRAFKITDAISDTFRIEGLRVSYRVGEF